MKIQLLIGLAIAVGTAAPAAPAYQDLDALDARVAAMSGPGSAVPIDKRIKLASCPEDPEISAPAAGAVAVRCPALGWRLKVALTSATRAAAVAAPALIHRGDAIELVAHGDGYSVSFVGTALDDGPAGAAIRVKIPTSSSPVAAIIARAGVASISD